MPGIKSTNLNHEKRILCQSFEELLEDVVYERDKVLVCLVFRQAFCPLQDTTKDIESRYLRMRYQLPKVISPEVTYPKKETFRFCLDGLAV